MDLYRVLLADDEPQIREGLCLRHNWEALGFTLVGQAENGQEALELAEQLSPDVIMTDIQMPFLTGLQLCEKLTKRLPASKFLLFSGFDDFDYAKQAIRMNVFEYILKPINTAELTEVLQKLKLHLDAERAEQKNLEKLRQLYEESRPVLRELFLTRLLEGRTHPDRIPEEAVQHQIDLSPSLWQVCLVQLEGVPSQHELMALSVLRLFEQHLDWNHYLCFLYRDGIALLVGHQMTPNTYGLINTVNRVCELSEPLSGVKITAGIGSPVPLSDMIQSTTGAQNALDYRVLHGSGRAIYIGDMEPDSQAVLTFDELDEHALSSAVKLGTESEVRAVVSNLMAKIQEAGLTLSQSHLFFLELINVLLKLIRIGNLEVSDVFGDNFNGSIQITDFSSTEKLGEWYLRCCLRLHALLGRLRMDSAGQLMERAKDYISTHYSDSELSVENLCDHLHLSPTYFSTLFKRETAMSFTSYVAQVRMEIAATMLRETDEKTYLIAERIGFEDPNYFSYVFKKHHGVTPSKFRNN